MTTKDQIERLYEVLGVGRCDERCPVERCRENKPILIGDVIFKLPKRSVKLGVRTQALEDDLISMWTPFGNISLQEIERGEEFVDHGAAIGGRLAPIRERLTPDSEALFSFLIDLLLPNETER